MKFKTKLLLLLTALHSINFSWAQEYPGKRDSLYSEILKENRTIQVVLPPYHKPGSETKYDVIYVLDANWNTEVMSQIHRFIKNEKHGPEVIIVGIFHPDRNKDLTPSHMSRISTSGGGPNFLSFIKKELIPYINKSYPANGDNILFGHSFGGLFAMYAYLTEPKLFSSYIAADPSFWWDEDYTIKLAREKLPSLAGLNTALFISGREDGLEEMGISRMDSVLKAKAPQSLFWKTAVYEDETHNTIKFKTMYDGLRHTYKKFNSKDDMIEYHPMNGIALKHKPFTISAFGNLDAIRYTSDNTTPALTSSKFNRENLFSGPLTLNVKAFTPRSKYDQTATAKFMLGKAPTPNLSAKNFEPGGLAYSYYQGEWDRIPNFKTLKPTKTGVASKGFNVSRLPSKTNFACTFDGLIEIKEEGYYVFMLNADDGAKFYLADKLLIDYDGLRTYRTAQSFLIPLKKGFYPIKIDYFQKDKQADMRIRYITPGKKEPIEIPFELRYSKK